MIAIPYKNCIRDVDKYSSNNNIISRDLNKVQNNNSNSISSGNTNNEKTEVFHGIQKTTKTVLDFTSNVDTAIDVYIDSQDSCNRKERKYVSKRLQETYKEDTHGQSYELSHRIRKRKKYEKTSYGGLILLAPIKS